MTTEATISQPLDAFGIIAPTLTISGICLLCEGKMRLPIDGFQCDECNHLWTIDREAEAAFQDDPTTKDSFPPDTMMKCGHPWSYYYDTEFCHACGGTGRRTEEITLNELFDQMERVRQERGQ